METTEINEPLNPAEQPIGLVLLEDAQYYLHQTGKWANFLAIMGFIGAGLCLLGGIFFGAIFSLISQYQPQPRYYPAAMGSIMGGVYVAMAVVIFFISFNLYQFAGGIKQGIEFKSAEQVSIALGKLKVFFKIKGIILICVLALYALVLIGAIIAGVVMHH